MTVIAGEMNEENSGDIFRLNCKVLEKANMSKLFDRTVNCLWPNGVQRYSMILFLTAAAPYMVKIVNSFKAP